MHAISVAGETRIAFHVRDAQSGDEYRFNLPGSELSPLERQALLDATKQRKSLELLRDKHEAQWRYEQNRRETNELDELATTRFARQVMIGGAQ